VAGTNVALNATGNIGTNAGSRLATAAGTLAAHGANVFIAETDAVTLDTVNSVTNTATTTYDLTATAITVTGANVGAGTNTFLDGSSITGSGLGGGHERGVECHGQHRHERGLEARDGGGHAGSAGANVFIAETDAVTLDTVQLGDQHGDDDL